MVSAAYDILFDAPDGGGVKGEAVLAALTERGIHAAATPGEVAAGADMVISAVTAKQVSAAGDATGPYYVVTDRWQKYTEVKVDAVTLLDLGRYCAEFLVHGVENEGKRCGILEDLVQLLGEHSPIPVTYAGGVRDISDLDRVKELGRGRVDLTIGSALDCFGGSISYDDVVKWHKKENASA